jgi:hypothetical protein
LVFELPSISDIADIIMFLVPGFVTFIIAKRIGLIEEKFSDLEIIVIIVILSLVDYIPFSLITGLQNFDKIRDSIFVPLSASILIGVTLVMGFGVGILFRIIFSRYSVHGSIWDVTFQTIRKKKGVWGLVITDSDKEYKGKIIFMSEGDTRELILKEPKQIIRNQNGSVQTEIRMGNELIFTNGDIKRVVLLS